MLLSKEQVRQTLEIVGYDGHGLYDSLDFAFLPSTLVRSLSRKHKSDLSSPKSTLFDTTGRVQQSIEGIYSLELLQAVAEDQKVDYTPAMGRGTEARRITDALLATLSPEELTLYRENTKKAQAEIDAENGGPRR